MVCRTYTGAYVGECNFVCCNCVIIYLVEGAFCWMHLLLLCLLKVWIIKHSSCFKKSSNFFEIHLHNGKILIINFKCVFISGNFEIYDHTHIMRCGAGFSYPFPTGTYTSVWNRWNVQKTNCWHHFLRGRPKRRQIFWKGWKEEKSLKLSKKELTAALWFNLFLEWLKLSYLQQGTLYILYLSIWIDSKPIVWDFSWYVSDINLVLV